MSPDDRDPRDRDPRDSHDEDARDHRPGSRDGAEAPGALRAAVPAVRPPARLEERVVASLAERGVLKVPAASRDPRRIWRRVGMLAAASVLFLAGGLAERVRAGGGSGDGGRAGGVGDAEDRGAGEGGAAAQDESPRFALLLYGGPPDAGGDEEAALVAEYGGWARDLATGGRFVMGEKLGELAIELGATGTAAGGPPGASAADPEPIVGFFIIGASSAAEAEAIAGTIPHLRHGGRVVIRPVDPT